MKALALWQPWASLWLSPRKIHETRPWCMQVPKGGVWIAVHATKALHLDKIEAGSPLPGICDREFGIDWIDTLPRGALIGVVHVVRCRPTDDLRNLTGFATTTDDIACGNWKPDRFAIERDRFHKFAAPISWKGKQGWFNVPDCIMPDRLERAA